VYVTDRAAGRRPGRFERVRRGAYAVDGGNGGRTNGEAVKGWDVRGGQSDFIDLSPDSNGRNALRFCTKFTFTKCTDGVRKKKYGYGIINATTRAIFYRFFLYWREFEEF
jgi:hypothetical protein